MIDRRNAATRKRPLTRTLLSTLTIGLTWVSPTASPADDYEVLLVGNSFSKGIKKPLRDALEADGSTATVKTRARPGWTLGKHAASRSTPKYIARAAWTDVFLQEQSDGIDDTRYPDARALEALIGPTGARTGFLMTWRDRGAPPSDYDSLRGMIGGSLGYVPIAHELDARLAPVGWVIRNAVENGPDIDFWKSDGHHLNRTGAYLAAITLFAAITNQSPVGLPSPRRLEDQAADLQALVEQTVFSEPETWNLP